MMTQDREWGEKRSSMLLTATCRILIPCPLVPPYERSLCYRKSGCCWRVGRLQRRNRAGRARGNTEIPGELLILLPGAVRVTKPVMLTHLG